MQGRRNLETQKPGPEPAVAEAEPAEPDEDAPDGDAETITAARQPA